MANELKRIKQAYQNLAHKVGDKCGLGELNYAEKQDFETLEKHEKAFEIIKEKRVSVVLLIEEDLVSYNYLIGEIYDYASVELTQEEYDLLKEVLL